MFTLTLTPQQMQVVLAGLGELPIKFGMDTMAAVQAQINAQGRANQPPPAPSNGAEAPVP
jgi:hypothetical protein